MGCVSREEIQKYESLDITGQLNFEPETTNVKSLEDSVSVFPVNDPQMVFKLHKRYSEVEIDMTYRKIEQLQGWVGFFEVKEVPIRPA